MYESHRRGVTSLPAAGRHPLASLDALHRPVVRWDWTGRVLFANHAYQALMASRWPRVRSLPIWEHTEPPGERERVLETFERVRSSRSVQRFCHLGSRDGTPFIGVARTRLLNDGGISRIDPVELADVELLAQFAGLKPGSWFSPVLSDDHGSGSIQWMTRLARLTEREREVLGLLVRGASPKDASTKLGISLHTWRNHTRAIYSKLEVRSRDEAWARFCRVVQESHAVFHAVEAENRAALASEQGTMRIPVGGVDAWCSPFELLDVPILVWSWDARVVFVNEAAVQLRGWPRERMLRTPIDQMFSSEAERERGRAALEHFRQARPQSGYYFHDSRAGTHYVGRSDASYLRTTVGGEEFVVSSIYPVDVADLETLVLQYSSTARDPEHDRVLPRIQPDSPDAWLDLLARLTPRERDVLVGLARGATPAGAAADYGMSLHTWRNHTRAIYGKLEVQSRDELWSGFYSIWQRAHAVFDGLGEGQRQSAASVA